LTRISSSFGNFVNRTLKFVSSQYDGVIPDGGDIAGPLSANDAADADFISDVNALIKDYTDAMEAVKLRTGLQTIMLISNRGNLYLQASGLNKALMAEKPTRCAQVVSRAVNLIYVLSSLIYPFMPATSDSILVQLNAPARVVPEVLSTDILSGHHIGKPDHLFKKIEEKMADVWRQKFQGVDGNVQAPPADASKRKAVAAKKAAERSETTKEAGPKSPEVLALEAKVADQGALVRSLKGQTPKTQEIVDQIANAVEELKRLKGQLATL
jgi:methionyl-tRNA synthetase